ncbi:MAG: c-type cytochrome [Acidobacteriota bacterium]
MRGRRGAHWLTCLATLAPGALLCLALGGPPAEAGQLPEDGEELYEIGCAKCHGMDGTGVDPETVGFDVPLPDFTDCEFVSREPDGDWIAVAHEGGPVRAFDRTMPAFGEAFTDRQLQLIMDHVRTFCTDDAWPRGELNLPRALVTEKAFPEDEAVWTSTIDAEGGGGVVNELLYERRFGPRGQVEVSLPLGLREMGAGRPGDTEWKAGIGDLAVGYKYALWHDYGRGAIFSLGGEVILPTGTGSAGLTKDTVVLEPYASFGQILPSDAFFQAQVGAELPTDTDVADNELFWRGALGRTWTTGRFGRAWSPMVELLGKAELADGGTEVQWDLLPQVQVSLNTRQHVLGNVGVRLPLTESGQRDTQLLVYVLWDWFDGGFFQGW